VAYSQNVTYYVKKEDMKTVNEQFQRGFTAMSATPDNTLIFMDLDEKMQNMEAIKECCGCLSACKFSGWTTHSPNFTTGKLPDLRSFCIRKSLIEVGHKGNVLNNILFSGKNAYKFKTDPLFNKAELPTVKELIEAIKIGQ
jgi:hypothetical protein